MTVSGCGQWAGCTKDYVWLAANTCRSLLCGEGELGWILHTRYQSWLTAGWRFDIDGWGTWPLRYICALLLVAT